MFQKSFNHLASSWHWLPAGAQPLPASVGLSLLHTGLSVAAWASSQYGVWGPRKNVPRGKGRSCRSHKAWPQKWHIHSRHILLAKTGHMANPDSGEGETDDTYILMGGVKRICCHLQPLTLPWHSVTHVYCSSNYTVLLRPTHASVSVPASVSQLRNRQPTQVFHLVHNVLLLFFWINYNTSKLRHFTKTLGFIVFHEKKSLNVAMLALNSFMAAPDQELLSPQTTIPWHLVHYLPSLQRNVSLQPLI